MPQGNPVISKDSPSELCSTVVIAVIEDGLFHVLVPILSLESLNRERQKLLGDRPFHPPLCSKITP
jgi:hypothetical protein